MEHNRTFVKAWGATVGELNWLPEQGLAAFEYAPEWVKSGIELSPLKMPLERAPEVFIFPNHKVKKWETGHLEGFSGLPGLFSDSLPDRFGQKVMQAENNLKNKILQNPVEALLYIGSKGIGALEYYPYTHETKSEPIDIQEITNYANRILSLPEKKVDYGDSVEEIKKALSIGSSVGGAVPKMLVLINLLNEEIRPHYFVNSDLPENEYLWENWLIKIDGINTFQPNYCQIEYAYYLMALDAGIEMTECRLYPDGKRRHFMTRRFDRMPDGQKLHYHSLHGMAHLNFQESKRFGYEDLLNTMLQLKLSAAAFEQQFKRMVFNLAACVTDDHTKNFGFLLNPTQKEWKLSPAFDLTFTRSAHALSLNGKYYDHTRSDLLFFADKFSIPNHEKLIEEVLQVVKGLPDYLERAGVEDAMVKRVSQFCKEAGRRL